MNARVSHSVCIGATRPPTGDDTDLVRRLVREWPVDAQRRAEVKRILNVRDCRLGVADGVVLVEAPGDCVVVALDIDRPGDDWAVVRE